MAHTMEGVRFAPGFLDDHEPLKAFSMGAHGMPDIVL